MWAYLWINNYIKSKYEKDKYGLFEKTDKMDKPFVKLKFIKKKSKLGLPLPAKMQYQEQDLQNLKHKQTQQKTINK